ncbi:hypothetical protein KM915_16885 [Cytobacillus oceanisediminis]|nr:hypothetical protein [Cytobacillus oceanisediminis]
MQPIFPDAAGEVLKTISPGLKHLVGKLVADGIAEANIGIPTDPEPIFRLPDISLSVKSPITVAVLLAYVLLR